MVVPAEILNQWLVLQSTGDLQKIVDSMAEDIRVSDETVRRALKTGKCKFKVFEAIRDYYQLKAEAVARLKANVSGAKTSGQVPAVQQVNC